MMRKITYMLLMTSLTFFCCDTRGVLTEENAAATFTARFYTTNYTVAVHSLNLITVEIDRNLNTMYTLRYETSGNITLYDRNMQEAGQYLAMTARDSLYFRANITGTQTLYFELENDAGSLLSDELAFSVTE